MARLIIRIHSRAHGRTYRHLDNFIGEKAPRRSGIGADSRFQVSVTRCLFSLFPVPAYLGPEALHDASRARCAVPYLRLVGRQAPLAGSSRSCRTSLWRFGDVTQGMAPRMEYRSRECRLTKRRVRVLSCCAAPVPLCRNRFPEGRKSEE